MVNGCQWLVEKAYNGPNFTAEDMSDPQWEPWYPDFPSDCVKIVPCGEPVDAEANGPFCTFHREPMEMSDVEFDFLVNEMGRSWS